MTDGREDLALSQVLTWSLIVLGSSLVVGLYGITVAFAVSGERVAAAIIAAVTGVVFGFAGWSLYSEWQTRFTEETLIQPTLRGLLVIRWQEVTAVYVNVTAYGGRQLEVKTADTTCRLSLGLRRYPERMLASIERRVRPGAFKVPAELLYPNSWKGRRAP